MAKIDRTLLAPNIKEKLKNGPGTGGGGLKDAGDACEVESGSKAGNIRARR